MRLTRVEARDFRCLADLDFAPAPGLNVLRGGNAQGKTSVLEAVLYAATSKSHRTNSDEDLARHGQPGFRVRLEADRGGHPVAVDAAYWQRAKRFKVNGIPQPRVSDILGRVHVVFFSPEDVELIRGGASGRRRFVDMELAQVSPPYLAALQRYRQVLRQRNELLRAPKADPELFDVWEAQLAEHGAAMVAARADFIAQLAPLAAEVHAAIAEGEALEMRYAPDTEGAEALREGLAKGRAADRKRGQTGRGPHRDDLELRVAGRPARAFASQGQQKTAALAIRLAELRLVRARVGEYPVLMLDEVLAELDPRRAAQLFAAVPDGVQSLVTTTALPGETGCLPRDAATFRIEQGRLRPET